MRICLLARRLPWLAPLLVSCGDDAGGAGETQSTSTTDVSSSSAESATTADAGIDTSGTASTGTDTSTGSEADSNGANAGPEANDDARNAAQDQPLRVPAEFGVLMNDIDPDGDTLMIVDADAVSAEGGTVLVDREGAVTYTPVEGFAGVDSFGYTVSDGLAEADAQVTVYVAAWFPIDGEAAGDQSGIGVSDAGDVDGDGLTDILVGAYVADPNADRSGRGYVVFGKADADPVELADIAGGVGGFTVDGESPVDLAGRSVSGVGDVDGDGLADFMLGAHGADPSGAYSGRSYVVFGKADTSTIELVDVTAGTAGFAIDGEAADDYSGFSVSGAGDVNGDGLTDFVVGAFAADPNGPDSGRCYVVFGKLDTNTVELGAITAGAGGFAIDGEAPEDLAGFSLSGAGDVNGDGLADVVVGAFLADASGMNSGRSYVVFGKADTAPVELGAIAVGNGGFAIDGESAYDRAGASVSDAGDVNGDGLADVVVGASDLYDGGFYAGRSYVVFGKADTDTVELEDIAMGDGGFAVVGEAEHQFSGSAVGSAGDVNGDGIADLVIGAPYGGTNGENSGRGYVVFGKGDMDNVDLAAVAAGLGGFVLHGEAELNFMGYSVSSAGDFNGDGLTDVVVGAMLAPNASYTGRTYVVFGTPSGD